MDYNDSDVIAAIQADDPGGDYASATAALAAMTTEEYTTRKVDENMLYGELGPSDAEPILVAIEGSDIIPPRVKEWIKPDKGGIDVGSAFARQMLDQMQTAGELSAAQADALKAMAREQRVKYPGIRAVHVKLAREAT